MAAALSVSIRAAVQLGGHVGQEPLDRLVLRDRPAERLARSRVRQRFVERRLPDAQRLGGNGDAAGLERAPGDGETLVLLADALVVAHRDLVEDQVHAAKAPHAERVDAGLVCGCPARSSGTTNAETPRPRAPGVVAANTIATPATSPLATHTLRPVSV